MDTNYRIAYNQGWKDLKKKIPEEVASRLSVAYSASSGQFHVTFFGCEYILDCNDETIKRKADGRVPDITASIIMLNYLSFSESTPRPVNKWVSLKEIPNGGVLFYPAFHKSAIKDLTDTFGQRPEQLVNCAAALGGQPAAMGSVSAVFHAFPEIPLCVVIWEGDEEVKANATILYDPSIAHLLHIESLIGLGMYLSTKLKQLAVSNHLNNGAI